MNEIVTRRHISARQAFIAIAVVLAIALVVLLIYLLFLLEPGGFTERVNSEPQARLKALLVISGPGDSDVPEFSRPMGVAYGPDGRIYVADTGNDRVCVFDGRGRFKFEFGGFGIAKPAAGVEPTWDEGELSFPTGIDVDEDGTVYVADFRNDSISVFDADGAFLRRFPDPLERVGKGGSGRDGLGIAVTDVAARDGLVYATDQYQVFVFTVEGEFVTQFGKPGLGKGDLDHPNGIEVDSDGTVYVADSNHNRVSAFTSDGDVIWTLGDPVTQIAGESEYVFGLPRGVALAEDGSLLVADAFEFDLVEVSVDGELVDRYGQRGVEPAQMNFPNALDTDGSKILIADKENDRVQVVEVER